MDAPSDFGFSLQIAYEAASIFYVEHHSSVKTLTNCRPLRRSWLIVFVDNNGRELENSPLL